MPRIGADCDELHRRLVRALEDLISASIGYARYDEEKDAALGEAGRASTVAWRELAAVCAGDPRFPELQRQVASVRASIGDRLFYDQNASDEAIAEFAAALELDPQCLPALKGIVAAYLQGEVRRPKEALPHLEALAAIEPRYRSDVDWVRTLIREG